ncbi:hypothetical protein M427DRAFT_306808 [Gonapodya prolifera JEL478]|uniref:Uncharacterized protein n=1 Tax=Gonapodya prolifera (strain JEL478) TaxID=1344416 RepID=A0A139AHE8_GONPJ|nr:hypothetical protein M427DRAFT_306808 [Gonapodya prolifera JEL478]|eukprot:KXS15984.1 hypothetical protein M427DRAFT_306808 [Gonapodya prolifera JEL478]
MLTDAKPDEREAKEEWMASRIESISAQWADVCGPIVGEDSAKSDADGSASDANGDATPSSLRTPALRAADAVTRHNVLVDRFWAHRPRAHLVSVDDGRIWPTRFAFKFPPAGHLFVTKAGTPAKTTVATAFQRHPTAFWRMFLDGAYSFAAKRHDRGQPLLLSQALRTDGVEVHLLCHNLSKQTARQPNSVAVTRYNCDVGFSERSYKDLLKTRSSDINLHDEALGHLNRNHSVSTAPNLTEPTTNLLRPPGLILPSNGKLFLGPGTSGYTTFGQGKATFRGTASLAKIAKVIHTGEEALDLASTHTYITIDLGLKDIVHVSVSTLERDGETYRPLTFSFSIMSRSKDQETLQTVRTKAANAGIASETVLDHQVVLSKESSRSLEAINNLRYLRACQIHTCYLDYKWLF